jgi:regulator of sirC expression with transglutaminase-like and TPR domain
MASENEIKALLVLLDDPDNEVYVTVAGKLLEQGAGIVPVLEQLWEVTPDAVTQERIEDLIHRVHFQDLQHELLEWSRSDQPELLKGAILIARYQYPQLNVGPLLKLFDQIRKNVWLELNGYLSPREQVNVINSILYSFYSLKGHELTEREPGHFFINQVLEGKQGNCYTLGIIYLALCETLDIPLFAVEIPRQFIFAYMHLLPPVFNADRPPAMARPQFYVDPMSGMTFSQKDVDVYLKKINARDRDSYFLPMLNKRIIYKMMEELCLCYRYRREEDKAEDIQQLMHLLGNDMRLGI